MTMTPYDREVLNTLHDMDKKTEARFVRLESKIEDGINGRFNNVEHRIKTNETEIKLILEDIALLKTVPLHAKSKWFDEVSKYIVLALLGYLLIQSGIIK